MRPEQQVAPPPHEPPVPTHGCTQTPALFRTRPAQHSEPLRAATPALAHVDRHARVEDVVEPTQYGALEQQGVVAEPHAVPDDRQVGAVPQTPMLHVRPEQHGEDEEQPWPASPHVGPEEQTPPEQVRPEQQGEVEEHVWPEARHVGPEVQRPPEQVRPAQQGEVEEQVSPCGRQEVG